MIKLYGHIKAVHDEEDDDTTAPQRYCKPCDKQCGRSRTFTLHCLSNAHHERACAGKVGGENAIVELEPLK